MTDARPDARSPESYPYATHLDVLHAPLEVVEEDEFFYVVDGRLLVDA